MKKASRIGIVALLLMLACTLPLLIYALPLGSYGGNSYKTEKFSENMPSCNAGVEFTGYRGNFSVGNFPVAKPGEYADFSGFTHDSNNIINKTGDDQWSFGGMYLHGDNAGKMILVPGYATAIAYTAPRSGTITIAAEDCKLGFELDNGVGEKKGEFAIFRNGTAISEWQTYNDGAAFAEQTLTVKAGDVLTFAFTRAEGGGYYARFKPQVTYTAYHGEEFAQAEGFTTVINGANNWYAYYGLNDGTDAAYQLSPFPNGTYFGSYDSVAIEAGNLTIGSGREAVLLFRSPIVATYTLSAGQFTCQGDVNVSISAFRSGTAAAALPDEDDNALDIDVLPGSITKTTLFNQLCTSESTFSDINNIYLDRGDILAIRFSTSGGSAEVTFTPKMTATETREATSRNSEVLVSLMGEKALMPQVRLTSTAFALTGELHMYFYVYFDPEVVRDAEEIGLLYYPRDMQEEAVKLPGKSLGNGQYVFALTSVNAKDLGNAFCVRAYADDLYDEERIYSAAEAAYAYRDLYFACTTPKSRALYELSTRILNYGAAAQKYFCDKNGTTPTTYCSGTDWDGYYVNFLLQEDTEAKLLITPSYQNGYRLDKTNATLDADFYGASLLLLDQPHFRLLINSRGMALSDLSLEVATDASFEGKTVYSLTDATLYSDTVYSFMLPSGLTANELEAIYYFRLTNGKDYSSTLTYSVGTYASRANNADRAVLDRLFDYAAAVKAYQTASEQPLPEGYTAISSASLAELIKNGTIKANGKYVLTDTHAIEFNLFDSNATYDLKGATIQSEGGLRLFSVNGLTLKNFTLRFKKENGIAIDLIGAQSIRLEGVTILNDATGEIAQVNTSAIRIDGDSGNVMLNDLRVNVGGIGVNIMQNAGDVYLVDSELTAYMALCDRAGAYVEYCTLTANQNGYAIYLDQSNGTELRDLTIEGALAAFTTRDLLISDCLAKDSASWYLDSCDNVSVVLCQMGSISVDSGKHIYVINNTASLLSFSSCNYLIADRNTCASGAVNVLGSNNQNINGDNLTNIEARLTVGADESLLPHVDKDQFLLDARMTTVRTKDGRRISVEAYLREAAKGEGAKTAVLAPGAYAISSTLSFTGIKDLAVYGFGTMLEKVTDGSIINLANGSENISFNGLTLGFACQSAGQAHILQKLDGNRLLAVGAAGMENKFGNMGGAWTNTGFNLIRYGTDYAINETSLVSVKLSEEHTGLLEIELSPSVYAMINVGDILSCRVNQGGLISYSSGCGDITYRDMVTYGTTRNFAFNENGNYGRATYYRVANTSRAAGVIDETTYNLFRGYEQTYGITDLVYEDANGNLRGTPALIGSVDATHTTSCKYGSYAIFCLFENMTDDGTNQNHTHGRVAEFKDNGDGTTTITYKGNLSKYSYDENTKAGKAIKCTGLCYPFKKEDRVYVYNSAGQLICDTVALSATVELPSQTAAEYDTEMPIRTVTVATDAINEAAYEGYDLSKNTSNDGPGEKVLIDNMSMASDQFLFDNTVVRNIRSRALLIKGSNATIKNCTFENIGMSSTAIHYEIFWGESGVSENLEVTQNLYKNSGYYSKGRATSYQDTYAPISILGLGSSSDADYLLYKNIKITSNRIEGRTTDYAIYVNSAKDITISGNTFGVKYTYDGKEDSNYNGGMIHVVGANTVTVTDNTYPAGTSVYVKYENALNVTGEGVFPPISFAGNYPTVDNDVVQFHGGWSVGYLNGKTYTRYGKKSSKYNIICQNGAGDGNQWTYGGMYYGDANLALVSSVGTTVAYTAPEAGSAVIGFDKLMTNSDKEGFYGCSFAIFKNGEMIWPKVGGGDSDWFTFKSPTERAANSPLSFAEEARAVAPFPTVDMAEGDVLQFAMKSGVSGMGYCVPCLFWTKKQDS